MITYRTAVVALFGIASQRYENRIDIIENRISSVVAQLTSPECRGKALERIPSIQQMNCPTKPDLFDPLSIVLAFGNTSRYEDGIEQTKEIVEIWKDNLDGLNLCGIDLSDCKHLSYAHLDGAYLRDAHLDGAYLWDAHLEGAILSYAHLEGADLWDAHLEGADLRDAHLDSAYIRGTDLRGVKNATVNQLSEAGTLYQAELDSALLIPLQANFPELFMHPDSVEAKNE